MHEKKRLVFTKKWSKLDDRIFTTIRKNCNFKRNEIVEVYIKETKETFNAELLLKHRLKLYELSRTLLAYDTDTLDKDAAIAVLQNFYRNKITEETEFYLLLLRKFGNVCPVCGKTTDCMFVNEYGAPCCNCFIYVHGKGGYSYEELRHKVGVICNECLVKFQEGEKKHEAK